MWGTFIAEAYLEGERAEVADALEEICSPRDGYGFASGGVYCFWSLRSRRPLYIGRAVDLPARFRRHNGLAGRVTRGSKLEAIDRHLGAGDPLGYSVLVRSPVSQTMTGRLRRDLRPAHGLLAEWVEEADEIDTETELEIAQAEGVAIRSHWLEHGELPAWNEIQGQATRWSETMRRPDSSGALFCASRDSLLLARRTLRELAADPAAVECEVELQLARAWAFMGAMLENRQLCDRDVLVELDGLDRWGGGAWVPHMREQGYLLDGPWLASEPPPPPVRLQREAWTAGLEIPPSPPGPPLREEDELPWA